MFRMASQRWGGLVGWLKNWRYCDTKAVLRTTLNDGWTDSMYAVKNRFANSFGGSA